MRNGSFSSISSPPDSSLASTGGSVPVTEQRTFEGLANGAWCEVGGVELTKILKDLFVKNSKHGVLIKMHHV